jgi:hypothetical protein
MDDNPKDGKWKNVHTGAEVRVMRCEAVPVAAAEFVSVWTLGDGTRWSRDQFLSCHTRP